MIELRNICKNYAVADSEVAALKNVSLAFRPNEFVAILGPSGGGKTTLLNIVGGLDHCSSGDLLINGRSTADFRDGDWDAYRNHAVGFIFQSYNLIPHQSVISNVELALTISGISAAQRRQKAQEALLAVGLQDQMYKKPNQLSGGQMQRVAIARALVNDPQIVLADEPTGALDTQSSLQVMDILKKVAKDRLVVMVTHNPELAEKYANRIITIRDGQITGDSNPYREMSREDGNAEIGRASMNLLTAFSLSLNNLMTKFGRTLLVSLAGSIGIIGIALIMALSNGVNRYIDEVQKNSLSSYPLTIENSDVDMTSAMMNMMGTAAKAVSEDGRIVEVPIIADMFNQIGANNLSLLKQHIERNWDTVGPLLSTMKYRYNINPQIYSADISEKVIKLSPASLFGRTGSSAMMSSSYSGRDVFQEMVDNQQLLEEQYEVLAGHWPQKFDELVLIIYDENTISDYLVYSLGLRDPEELRDYFSKVMNGEPVNVDNVPMSFKPEDLLGMEFRLVLAADYYRYDEAHDIWEDMTSDEEYMKQLVSDGVKLKITGIVIPREGVSGTVMTPGVGYTSALMEYIVRESASKQVVIQQLEDRNRDVFSRRSFEDINKKVETEIDFSDMFTFDENRFASAFSMNIDTNALSSSLAGIMNTSMNRLVSDLAGVTSDVSTLMRQCVTGMFSRLMEEGFYTDGQMPQESDIDRVINQTLDDEDISREMRRMEQLYGITVQESRSLFSSIMKDAAISYQTIIEETGTEGIVPLTPEISEQIIAMIMESPASRETVSRIARAYGERRISREMNAMAPMMASALASQMGNAMTVDAKAIQESFSFSMKEDDFRRYMMTFMDRDSGEASADSNLRALGYCSFDEPVSLSLYFMDFEAKETFKDFLSEYNTRMENNGQKENVIVYTDITGIMISSVTSIINAISYVLIAFVSVSLVVSSIMIGIITYISVLERTKEIGILRSLGASKMNVANVFNAETFIIGLCAGTLGVIITMLLCHPINWIVRAATKISSITAYLPLKTGLILILISVVLTMIAGIIPASMATRCDPVTALRTE